MIAVAMFLGANETKARKEMLKVLQFEMKLANITSKSSDIRQIASSNPIPLNHLKAGGVYPNHTWAGGGRVVGDDPPLKKFFSSTPAVN